MSLACKNKIFFFWKKGEEIENRWRLDVSGLKTECSRSYVCSTTLIFSRCSLPSSLFHHPLTVSSLQRRSFRAFSSSLPLLSLFYLFCTCARNERRFITELTNSRNGASPFLFFTFPSPLPFSLSLFPFIYYLSFFWEIPVGSLSLQ